MSENNIKASLNYEEGEGDHKIKVKGWIRDFKTNGLTAGDKKNELTICKKRGKLVGVYNGHNVLFVNLGRRHLLYSDIKGMIYKGEERGEC